MAFYDACVALNFEGAAGSRFSLDSTEPTSLTNSIPSTTTIKVRSRKCLLGFIAEELDWKKGFRVTGYAKTISNHNKRTNFTLVPQ